MIELSKKNRTWHRGGSWEIVWRGPLREEDPGGEFRGFKMEAWTYECTDNTTVTRYDPLKEEPTAYLAFSTLGKAVWDSFGMKVPTRDALSWKRIEISEELKDKAINFIEEYGPPVAGSYPTISFPNRTLIGMLKEAQLIEFALTYHQVIQQGWTPRLGQYTQSLIQRAKQDLSPGSPDGKYIDDMLNRNINFDGQVEVIPAAKWIIEAIQRRQIALGGLTLVAEPHNHDDWSEDWKFTLEYGHLINLLWYQVIQAIVRGSFIRTCQNERCSNKGRLFETDRPNQLYCSTNCRNSHNVQMSRNRSKRKSLGDVLP